MRIRTLPAPIVRGVTLALLLFVPGMSADVPTARPAAAGPRPPNVVIVLADDLGYGDVSAFNPDGRVPTPHMDRLAAEGIRFTDAHTSSAVCSPTRYGLLTGRYAWRTRLQSGVLWGESAPLVEPGRVTLASLLRERGYHTAAIGKWHLGLGWAPRAGATPSTTTQNQVEWIDYARPVHGGPLAVGFDQFFGIPASLDMPPYVFVDGDLVQQLPTETLPGESQNLPGFYRGGLASPGFRVESVLGTLADKAVAYISERAASPGQPFFLYLALTAPHTPVVPTPAFSGSTGIGPYGDFVSETDAVVGRVVGALDQAGLARDTLVVVTSDNGPSPAGGIAEAKRHGHDASGGWRGAKADLYEGGHRVPFIVRWPGVAPAGATSTRLVGTVDLLATVADLVGAPLPRGAGEDSVSFAPALRDPSRAGDRGAALVVQSVEGAFAIREGRHKLLLAPGSGGWSDPRPGSPEERGLPPTQLYDLTDDPRETRNLASARGDVAVRLEGLLSSYKQAGRSAPAPPAATPQTVARRPNVLFLFSDDQRADTVGAWGNRHVATPNLDRLVSRGASFTHAYIMGAFQGAVCTPSRAMLMTSQSLLQVREDLDGQATWPEQFGRAGYQTFLSGKWHNGEASATRLFERGRSVFFGGMAAPYDLQVKDFTRGVPGLAARTATTHDAEAFADAAIEFLRERRDGRPFLAYVAFKAPHDPRVAPPRWHERFTPNPPPLPPDFLPLHPFDNGEMTVRDEQLLPWPRSEAPVRRELADYYASIGFLDEQVGRVLDELRRSGLEDDTIVVFASDNGLAIGSHGLMGKQNLYEHSVRVPLIVAGPGVPAGLRSDALCYLQDVFPTLADLAGVASIDGIYGRSLRGVLDDPGAPFRPAIFTAYRDIQRAVRDTRFKLIRYPRVDRTQLFDLQADPWELTDLAARPGHEADLVRMRRLLAEARAQLGDTAPLEVPSPASGAWTPPPPSSAPPRPPGR